MKTPSQIYSEVHAKYGVPGGKADRYDIEAMEIYANQFKTKICPCQQQEAELKEIKRVNQASQNKL